MQNQERFISNDLSQCILIFELMRKLYIYYIEPNPDCRSIAFPQSPVPIHCKALRFKPASHCLTDRRIGWKIG